MEMQGLSQSTMKINYKMLCLLCNKHWVKAVLFAECFFVSFNYRSLNYSFDYCFCHTKIVADLLSQVQFYETKKYLLFFERPLCTSAGGM